MSITFKNVNEKVKSICDNDAAFDGLDRKELAAVCSEIYTLECSIEEASGTVTRRDKIKGLLNQKYLEVLGQSK